MHTLFFVTGASGAGKTTAMKALETRRPDIVFRFLDAIGVPSLEKMIEDNRSPEEWQRQTTIKWVRRIKMESLDDAPVILDRQTRQSFIVEACRGAGVSDYKIILFDCGGAERERRLIARGHPELANDQMASWATYLRRQALMRGDVVIDTTGLIKEQVVDRLEREVTAQMH